jgi:hypothetical protein
MMNRNAAPLIGPGAVYTVTATGGQCGIIVSHSCRGYERISAARRHVSPLRMGLTVPGPLAR